ncbi:hypothetical protein Rs2_43962 [Raphanus sativus]|nr:hypothetical protein Rs2_43962 [Raphanus sativus]
MTGPASSVAVQAPSPQKLNPPLETSNFRGLALSFSSFALSSELIVFPRSRSRSLILASSVNVSRMSALNRLKDSLGTLQEVSRDKSSSLDKRVTSSPQSPSIPSNQRHKTDHTREGENQGVNKRKRVFAKYLGTMLR